MFLPFALPHAGLQNLRRRMFYWRVVYSYRLANQTGALTKDKVGYKLVRVFGVVLFVKMVEKGARALKEEQLHDYATRKANISAAEKAMWEQELALHTVDRSVAESAVLRQRTLDWTHRSDAGAHATALTKMLYPVVLK